MKTTLTNAQRALSMPPGSGGVSDGWQRGRTFGIMTYSDKLKSSQWASFRERVFSSRGKHCETCGSEDKSSRETMQVHHIRYIRGSEPWEYEMDDVRVYCRECHEEIHACEESWRNFIRSLPSHCILEFQSLVEELVNIEPDMAKGVAAYAKNDARRRRYNGGRKEPTKETKELVAEWYENFKAKLEEVE